VTLADRIEACLLKHESLTASQISIRLGVPTVSVREALKDPRFAEDTENGFVEHGFRVAACRGR
jgi:predicted ArsR family transcriptional regulator